jgi:hypothetical protein
VTCPLCRIFADLEVDVEVEINYEEEWDDCVFDIDVSGDWVTFLVLDQIQDWGYVLLRGKLGLEGDGPGLGFFSRLRARRGTPSGGGGGSGNGDRASPIVDLTDEPVEEIVMDISQPAPSGGEMGVIVIGGDADGVMDDARMVLWMMRQLVLPANESVE